MDSRDVELLNEAKAKASEAISALTKAWERHTGLKVDAMGELSSVPSEADAESTAPEEVRMAISSLSEAVGFINDLIGG